MKILNLYAGIGGNRKLWEGVEVTAVEYDKEIAKVYKELYPKDTVIVADAHAYLEINYESFDFIWSSPPCPSHGQYRHNVGVIGKGYKPILPDMSLYSEIVFLQTYFGGLWVVENVKPYYKPLITPAFEMDRHLFWANFDACHKLFKPSELRTKNKITDFDECAAVQGTPIKNKRQVLRNQVNSDVGLHILNCALNQSNGLYGSI